MPAVVGGVGCGSRVNDPVGEAGVREVADEGSDALTEGGTHGKLTDSGAKETMAGGSDDVHGPKVGSGWDLQSPTRDDSSVLEEVPCLFHRELR